MKYLFVFALTTILVSIFPRIVLSQSEQFDLWKDTIPGAIQISGAHEDTLFMENGIRIKNVVLPTLTGYFPDTALATGAAIVICPGGGYERLAISHEGYDVGKWFALRGVAAFVLKYRLPADSIMHNKSVGPLMDAQEAIRTVRRNASRWHINPHLIGVMGFSAGGHLAATASTLYADSVYASDGQSARPDFAVLAYPVISMNDSITHKKSKLNLLGSNPASNIVAHYSAELQITPRTPPTYIIHSSDDTSVPVENTLRYYKALRLHAVDAEMHIYKTGGHGYGLVGKGGEESNWTNDLQKWLVARKIAVPVQ
ncbi:MAG: alpha/beta hydrolase [Ignavibacteriales bacterium]|nr:alpha/beta hydrolase [Ignavibacteriales bacterium]